MTWQDIMAKLLEWQANQAPFTAACRAFMDLTGAQPDSDFLTPVYAVWDAYTRAVGEIIGDEEEWLSWYEYECDMGERPKEVSFPDGREITVATLADLAKVIADESHAD